MSRPVHQNKLSGVSLGLQFTILTLMLLLVSACEDEVNPFIGTELPYTAWGMVNPKADTQAVRVFLIDDVLQLVSPDPLDATVSIIDIENSTRYLLQDSVIQLLSGDSRHIFWAQIEVDHLDRYRLEVERSDGQLTKSQEVQVPGPTSLHVIPANTNALTQLIQPLYIEGGPPSTPKIDVTYNAYTVSLQGVRLEDNPVTISYANKPRIVTDTLRLDLDLRDDFIIIREDFNDKEFAGFICLDNVVVDVHVGNKEWVSPTGVFDPNFLVEPGTFSNIENGFGFFGAGYVESITFNPPSLLLVRAGFFDCSSQ